jgi:hypothetical protein
MSPRLLLLALVVVALVPAATGQAQPTRLVGTVGPGFTIGLTDATGSEIRALDAGRYDVLVRDLSDEHNFVLGHKATGRRPISTEVAFIGETNVVVDLAPGQWVFACSPHFDTMNGQFSVAAAPTPPPPPTPPKRLAASVTARRVSLAPTRVEAGRYLLTVADRSTSRGFRLVGAGIDRRTGIAYTGTRSWTLRLRSGTYRFGDQRRIVGRLTVR